MPGCVNMVRLLDNLLFRQIPFSAAGMITREYICPLRVHLCLLRGLTQWWHLICVILFTYQSQRQYMLRITKCIEMLLQESGLRGKMNISA